MRKLAWFACAFAVPVFACVYLLPLPPVWVGVLIALAGLALLALRRRCLRRLIAVLLGFGVGLAWTSGYYGLHLDPALQLSGSVGTYSGIVRACPVTTKYGCRADIDLEYQGDTYLTVLYLDETDTELNPGDRVTVTAELEAANYAYSQEHNLYYRSLGYVLVAYAQGEVAVTPAEHIPLSLLPAWFSRLVQRQIEKIFPADTVAFMKALLTGNRSEFDYQTRNDLSLAGVTHVVAISGMHVSILLGGVLLLSRRKSVAAALGIPVVLFYVVMTGGSASVLRAAVMQILLLLSPLAKRETDLATSLSAAMLLILLMNPWAVADLSFQLSFAAMSGILWVTPRIRKSFDQRFPHFGMRQPWRGLCNALKASVSTTLGAILFTTPVVACSFGVISLLSVATNFLTLWAVTLCFRFGMLACLFSFVALTPAAWLASILAWLIRYFFAVTHVIAGLPFAAVYTQSSYIVLWLVFVYGLIGLFLAMRKQRRPLIFAGCLLAGLGICAGLSILESRVYPVQTTVLDVGQGQCVLLEWDRTSVMVDCGGPYSDDTGELAARLLLSHGRTKLDCLILTHYDADHAGGIAHLLSRIHVARLYLPPAEEDDGLYTSILAAAAENGTAVTTVTADRQLSFGQTVLQIYAPLSHLPGNDGGLSVLCSRQDYDIVITGDMSVEGEHRLLQLQNLPKVELLLAGHHGAATSTGEELLQAVRPDTVLISVGAGNRYGHPSQEVLDRIAAVGAAVYRTDLNATITIRR